MGYVVRRLTYIIIILWLISVVTFVIIQLPPGDYLTTYLMKLAQSGQKLKGA